MLKSFCTLSTHANLGQAGSKIKFFENARHLAGSNFGMPVKVIEWIRLT